MGDVQVETGFTALFFTDRWYNVYHQHRPHGWRGLEVYVNVGSPVRVERDVITWVDLDVDVVLERSGVVIDDEDEFAEHRVRMAYPDVVVERVRRTTAEVARELHAGTFPFDRETHVPGAAPTPR